ncbi:helix-turn-helix domain-containing protein [Marinovum sp.]|uniref:helix-turn-helix domain-containing protein n=1 Tax=Marinovum sp. TaxID=2024839 RepID=UPI002B26A07D|nr:helix-turn-helix domain-containing protein [Marinovum sp.]
MKNRGSFAAVVERDTGLRNTWAGVLQDCGLPRVLRRARPSEMRETLTEGAPLSALIVGLSARQVPDEAMLTLIAAARRQAGDAVILAIDHANRSQGAIAAFAAGADDALRADHDPGELRARLSLRLQGAQRGNRKSARLVQLGLTPVEERIFEYMSRHAGQIVERAALAQVLGDADWSYGDRRIDVHIARIRQKLEHRSDAGMQVRSVRGRGYILDDPDRD